MHKNTDKNDINRILSEKDLLDAFAEEAAKEVKKRSPDDLDDAEVGRRVIDLPACPPELKTKTKVKRAKALLAVAPQASVEFSCTVTRAKYNTTGLQCNAVCVAFVGYIPDEEIPEEIIKEIKKSQK